AFAEANAYYAREHRGLYFGYVPRSDGTVVDTSLSHDIVAHETTHAILDGLRERFLEPALPDQAAFHEALADVVALCSAFSLPEVLDHALGEQASDGRIPASVMQREALARSVLFSLAEQLGEEISGVRGSALRRSLQGVPPGDAWRSDPAYLPPH